ncbi:MAG: DUF4292 domain-containing protein [Muribaculaceae bacterium]|nr:DUF4292 domain-containing protein [Muribaculaceae bacterium]
MKNHKLLYLCTLLLAVAASSCHKKGNAPAPLQVIEAVSDSLQKAPTQAPASSIIFPATFGEWSSLEVPVNIRLTSPKSLSCSGRATLVKGREIYISLRIFGMEVGQLYASEDSIFVVDKFHKYCIAESIARLGASTGLTLADLQGYLLGRPERAVPEGIGGIEVLYDWNPATQELGAVGFTRDGVPVAGIEYGDIEKTSAGPTAASVALAAVSGKSEVAVKLDYSLTRAKWNSIGDSIKFRRPGADYKRISLIKLAESL